MSHTFRQMFRLHKKIPCRNGQNAKCHFQEQTCPRSRRYIREIQEIVREIVNSAMPKIIENVHRFAVVAEEYEGIVFIDIKCNRLTNHDME